MIHSGDDTLPSDDRSLLGRLVVDRAELMVALQLMTGKGVRRMGRQKVVLRFQADELRITLGDRSTGAAARGEWPGGASVHPRGLRGLLAALPDSDTVTLFAEGRWVRIGSTSIGSKWTGPSRAQIEIPLNPSAEDLLRSNARHSSESVTVAGVRPPVEHDGVGDGQFSPTQRGLNLEVDGDQRVLGED